MVGKAHNHRTQTYRPEASSQSRSKSIPKEATDKHEQLMTNYGQEKERHNAVAANPRASKQEIIDSKNQANGVRDKLFAHEKQYPGLQTTHETRGDFYRSPKYTQLKTANQSSQAKSGAGQMAPMRQPQAPSLAGGRTEVSSPLSPFNPEPKTPITPIPGGHLGPNSGWGDEIGHKAKNPPKAEFDNESTVSTKHGKVPGSEERHQMDGGTMKYYGKTPIPAYPGTLSVRNEHNWESSNPSGVGRGNHSSLPPIDTRGNAAASGGVANLGAFNPNAPEFTPGGHTSSPLNPNATSFSPGAHSHGQLPAPIQTQFSPQVAVGGHSPSHASSESQSPTYDPGRIMQGYAQYPGPGEHPNISAKPNLPLKPTDAPSSAFVHGANALVDPNNPNEQGFVAKISDDKTKMDFHTPVEGSPTGIQLPWRPGDSHTYHSHPGPGGIAAPSGKDSNAGYKWGQDGGPTNNFIGNPAAPDPIVTQYHGTLGGNDGLEPLFNEVTDMYHHKPDAISTSPGGHVHVDIPGPGDLKPPAHMYQSSTGVNWGDSSSSDGG